jgi:hypothetical protein|tara:strand:- start:8271 stop:8657 length:387 start_codon:yes stop_codon:yes gene_type:complete
MSNIINEGEDQLDLDTGFFTRQAFLEGSEACERFEETITQLIKDTKKVENGREWFLTTITLPGGILFPDGKVDDYRWIVAPVVNITQEDKGKYPIPGEGDETYNTRVGIEDAKKFDQFKEALVYLGML